MRSLTRRELVPLGGWELIGRLGVLLLRRLEVSLRLGRCRGCDLDGLVYGIDPIGARVLVIARREPVGEDVPFLDAELGEVERLPGAEFGTRLLVLQQVLVDQVLILQPDVSVASLTP